MPNLEPEVTTIETGHGAGLSAMLECVRAVQNGDIRFGVAGGVDSYCDPETLESLEEEGRLHTPRHPYGFIPGEAAGFCVIASADAVPRWQLQEELRIIGAGRTHEPHSRASEGVCTGEALSAAIEQASHSISAPIDQTICDLNGESYRADEYSFALVRTRPAFSETHTFITPADCWGDVGAASGPLFAMVASARYRKHHAAGPRTLLWAGGDSGERVAMVVAAPME
jgi:3-oxoacyl-[acyl-carrier-protein] synthase-1